MKKCKVIENLIITAVIIISLLWIGSIKYGFHIDEIWTFHLANYQYNDTTYGTLAYYLNKTYYKGLDYGSIIVENNYTNSTYGEDNNYSLEELSKNTISTKIALPSINDIIVNDEIEGYVTTTGVSENDTYIYIRNASGTISQKNISYENKVRPCISIKKESLTQGNGTEKDPYRLGE